MGIADRLDLGVLHALGDPLRRRLYDFVAAAREPVGRDEAAAATGIRRSLAAYHLDRLARSGLLEVSYRRLGGRAGPGAGRPAKLYRRAEREFVLRVPHRDYRLLGEILLRATLEADSEPLRAAIEDTARREGRRLGEEAHAATPGELLRARGYEPFETEDGTLRLRNCPFAASAAEFTERVCTLNLALVEGLLEGAGNDPSRAVLAPSPGTCCVEIAASER